MPTVCVVVDEIKALLVIQSTEMSLSNPKTDGIGKTLSEGSSGDLNAISVAGLRMARGK